MLPLVLLFTAALSTFAHPTQATMHSTTREKAPFPASYELFSSQFKQPDPPLVKAEFKCHWTQHKWNPNVSHIAAGYLYHSPTHLAVRVDGSYDANIVSSLFDYNTTNSAGEVFNTLYTITPSVAAAPQIWTGYATPGWALFSEDFLVKSNAVFSGVVEDRWAGEVATWKIIFEGAGPVTVFLDSSGVVVGYDFYDVSTRTGIVNRFFNIEFGVIDKAVFEFPKKE